MKKSYLTVFACCFFVCLNILPIHDAVAGVYFITKTTDKNDGVSNKPCQMMGYKVKAEDCKNGEEAFEKCPNGDYYKGCACNTSKLPYNTANCAAPLELSGNSCNDEQFEKCECNATKYPYTTENCKGNNVPAGSFCKDLNDITHYEKCSCASSFPYTSSNCSSPKILGGNTCQDSSNVTYYKTCSCPSTYVTCNCGGEGTSCNDGTQKYASCKSCCTDTCPSGVLSCPIAGQYGKYVSQTSCGKSCYQCYNYVVEEYLSGYNSNLCCNEPKKWGSSTPWDSCHYLTEHRGTQFTTIARISYRGTVISTKEGRQYSGTSNGPYATESECISSMKSLWYLDRYMGYYYE
ncbi:MAG: hypothetical protein PHE89_03440 [Alphaproteobacteria bacterium]|nr:hypothetical protein [Alphaproteobacteria bacterium]